MAWAPLAGGVGAGRMTEQGILKSGGSSIGEQWVVQDTRTWEEEQVRPEKVLLSNQVR